MRAGHNNSEPIRGLMIDAARLTERIDFYYELITQLADWGYNTVWWHFCDDEGFALKLKSHPEFASPYALTTEEMKELTQHAKIQGIDLVPEVESLGHALAITSLPQYSHLFNGNPQGHNALCPSHPDTLELLADIIEETIEISDSNFLHVGLDEANIGDCARCADKTAGQPPWWLFAEHAKAVHKLVTEKGRRMIMWADMVEKYPELLEVLPKDIVLTHWHYTDVPAEIIRPSADAGFNTVCAGAISNPIIQPGEIAFKNVADNARLVDELSSKGCLGMAVCWWESHRHLRDTYPLAAKYAVDSMRSAPPEDMIKYTDDFIREYFGVEDKQLAWAFWNLQKTVFDILTTQTLFPRSFVAFHNALLYEKSHPKISEQLENAEESLRIVRENVKTVSYNRDVYNAYLLAGRINIQALHNALQFRAAFQHYSTALKKEDSKCCAEEIRGHLKDTYNVLQEVSDNVSRLVEDVSAEWDRTRHPDDLKKYDASPYMRQRGARGILPILFKSDKFLRKTVEMLHDMYQHFKK